MTSLKMRDNMNQHGYYGCGAVKGSSPPRLSCGEIEKLQSGRRVVVTWDGGNGPHLYEVVEERVHPHDMEKMWLKDRVCRVKVSDLLEYPCNYVSLP